MIFTFDDLVKKIPPSLRTSIGLISIVAAFLILELLGIRATMIEISANWKFAHVACSLVVTKVKGYESGLKVFSFL